MSVIKIEGQVAQDRWYFLDINPEGWAVGPLGVMRKSGKLIPYIGRNQQLHNFKEAVKHEFENRYEKLVPVDEDVELCVYFWQRLDTANSSTGRKSSDKAADLTNMVKAAEDAIQGVLIKNDNKVMAQRNVIVERGPNARGGFAICVRDWRGCNPDEIPQYIWDQLDMDSSRSDNGTNSDNVVSTVSLVDQSDDLPF